MTGILYGVGVGPGDPEMMTLKAIRIIRENDVVALPGPVARETTAYGIAVQAVPELEHKTLLSLDFPMVMDRGEQERYHRAAARTLEQTLDAGKNVVFLTLGDVTVYSTFSYVQHIVEEDGYQVRLINGVPSFCAAAAALGQPLTEWTQMLHVIPAVHRLDSALDMPGNYVLMKSGTKMEQVKQKLRESGRRVMMVENCGMPEEKRYYDLEDIPDRSGYFSLIIAKEDAPGYEN